MGTWIGEGGDGNNNLVQTGIDEEGDLQLLVCRAFYNAWVDNVDNRPGQPDYNSAYGYGQTVVPYNANPGDEIYAYVDQYSHMCIEDQEVGNMWSDCYNYGAPPNTHTFECIDEQASGGWMGLSTTYFGQCDGQDSNGYHHPMGINSYAWYNRIIQVCTFPGFNCFNDYYPGDAPDTSCSQCGGFYIDFNWPPLG
jgi:hypothetical protein